MQEQNYASPDPSRPERGFWGRLAQGEFGLAKTYWVYNVVVGIAANLIANEITSLASLTLFMALYVPYQATVLMGIWRAAGTYQGLKIWAMLARAAVVLGSILLAFSVLGLLNLLVQG
ncbi:hypothetical protein SAMN05660860_02161 [Geoalkalibacter ferrihydriticus]|uniref:Uncharacterized protein n=2 Tax=Geoalkalibacter ferrihydriticus TaxID=392333 RepID=A0A0C2HJL5_9BACT|nr:hypothetical protein [Geoalkalibacter ferrihydriticus]KIH77251.1 hypothetical protein GFER_00320 [Geoalkalibacter ferrihydriticus DSM 17813]SDM23212.1 hypothetical protein SAMN05660860_02161 [Geoalkalibacter ferrihydriticus]